MAEYQRSPTSGPGLPRDPAVSLRSPAVSSFRLGPGAAALPLWADLVIAGPEVAEKARRRQFSAAYKLRVLKEADAFDQPGHPSSAVWRRSAVFSVAAAENAPLGDGF